MRRDVMVLGAGIVGLATALKLQEKGLSVALVDRHGAGQGTSFGNAGIIERASIYPYAFPRSLPDLVRYALNGTPEAHYHWRFLPRIAPWLARYWWHSSPARHEAAMRAVLPLIEHSAAEHEPLVSAAGAQELLRRNGWIKLFRSQAALDAALVQARRVAQFGLTLDVLDPAALREREPHLTGAAQGAIHYRDPVCVSDPAALSQAYLRLFTARGGDFEDADARRLERVGADWTVPTRSGVLRARHAVLALGPWAPDMLAPLGYRLPLAVKRGYHLHFRPKGNAVLHHTVLDAEKGYVLAPMDRGIRLTTGAEFADRDAPPTPVQIGRTEPLARALFPLGEAIEPQPWMGSRPCTPDMLPIVGPAGRHPNLWFNFGHAHHGLTLAGSTGRLIAELIAGEEPFTDPRPYAASRFAGRRPRASGWPTGS